MENTEKQELDLTLMNMTNENSRMNRELYQNYANKSKKASKQEIHGKTYVGSKNKKLYKIIGYSLAAIAAIVGITAGAKANEKVSIYNDVLETKMEQELNQDQVTAYHNDQDKSNALSNWLDKKSKINDAFKELNPDDYNFHGARITDSDIEYIPFDGDSLFNLSEKEQDAIASATDKVIEEYKGRAR